MPHSLSICPCPIISLPSPPCRRKARVSWGHLLLQPTLSAVPVPGLLTQMGISEGETTRHRCLCRLSCPLHAISLFQESCL